jgi:hypothetical protein
VPLIVNASDDLDAIVNGLDESVVKFADDVAHFVGRLDDRGEHTITHRLP